MPDFGDSRPEKATDFNDLAQYPGPEVVNACIMNAKPPARDGVHTSNHNAPADKAKLDFTSLS